MESQSSTVGLVKELKDWCRREELDEHHSLMVLIPEEVENAVIEEAMGTIKALGRVRVVGRTLSLKLNRLTVLCESKERVDPNRVPSVLVSADQTEKWRIVIASEISGSGGSVSPNPLKSLLEDPPAGGSAESIIRAVGDLLAKMEKPSGENSSYRRLRVFSGTLPTPVGEESLEHWLEHARLMLEESDCSAKEKTTAYHGKSEGSCVSYCKGCADC